MSHNGTHTVKDTATGAAFPGQSPALAVLSPAARTPHCCAPRLVGRYSSADQALSSAAPEPGDAHLWQHRECADRCLWQTIVPVWPCSGGHLPAEHPDDQVHCGYPEYVPASRMPLHEQTDGSVPLSRVEVCIVQHDRAAAAHISLGMEEERSEIQLTAPEARQLATVLTKLADQIGGGQ